MSRPVALSIALSLALVCTLSPARQGQAADALSAKNLRILSGNHNGIVPKHMMKQWLLGRVNEALDRREATLATLDTPAKCQAYQKRMRAFMLEQFGGFPERTPLSARVVGTIERPTFRVEKVIYESRPGVHVTAALFLPPKSDEPVRYPAVLVSCGHARNAKAYPLYQQGCIELAEHGVAALIYDPIGQGERWYLLDDQGQPRWKAAMDHLFGGQTCMLVGRNIACEMTWDGIRGVDYLCSREDIDPERIGAAGNSGGGTQTSYIMALEPRARAAAPSCFTTHSRELLRDHGPGDHEQNIHGQLDYGLSYAEYSILRAPRATLICAAEKDYFPIAGVRRTVAEAKAVYEVLGVGDRMDLAVSPSRHGWSDPLRSATVRWMLRWLDGQENPTVKPCRGKPLAEKQILCTPRGQALLMDGARCLYDVNRRIESQLAEQRAKFWQGNPKERCLEKVRELAGIRPLDELPEPDVETAGRIDAGSFTVEKIVLRPEPGILLPTLLCVPKENRSGRAWLSLGAKKLPALDSPSSSARQRLAAGDVVAAVDLRGVGETKRPDSALPQVFYEYFDTDWQDVMVAYQLGRAYTGMRAEDALVAARWLAGQDGVSEVHLTARKQICVPALHAAALEPRLFTSVELIEMPCSWSQCVAEPVQVRRWADVVHGALEWYDLDDLLRVVQPARADSTGQ